MNLFFMFPPMDDEGGRSTAHTTEESNRRAIRRGRYLVLIESRSRALAGTIYKRALSRPRDSSKRLLSRAFPLVRLLLWMRAARAQRCDAPNQGAEPMWVTKVRQLPDGEEMIWTEPAPSERELFARDPRRIVLETRGEALRARRAPSAAAPAGE
jgi:hypothetical protein